MIRKYMKFFAHQGHSALQATGFSYLKIIPHEKKKTNILPKIYVYNNKAVSLEETSILRGD
jgi:hypothetical protein